MKSTYRISGNSFRGNYSFLNLEILENSNSYRKFQFLTNKLIFCFGNYSRAETICGNTVPKYVIIL